MEAIDISRSSRGSWDREELAILKELAFLHGRTEAGLEDITRNLNRRCGKNRSIAAVKNVIITRHWGKLIRKPWSRKEERALLAYLEQDGDEVGVEVHAKAYGRSVKAVRHRVHQIRDERTERTARRAMIHAVATPAQLNPSATADLDRRIVALEARTGFWRRIARWFR